MKKTNNINRREFLELIGCSCCGVLTASCTTVPVLPKEKQLTIYPEATINRQAAKAYENFKSKAKLITSGSDLEKIKNLLVKELKMLLVLFLIKITNQIQPKIFNMNMFWLIIRE